jgi:Cytochrome c554 and c-prime
MKTGIVVTFSLFAIALSSLIKFNPENLYQLRTFPEKSENLLSRGKDSKEQEKTKYLFVGAEKCAGVCHNNEKMGYQFNSWSSSPHKDAFNILVSKKGKRFAKQAHLSENPQESRVCLKCHVTGGDLDSSYFSVNYKKEDGVTCEECHKKISDGKTYLPTETECLKCHNDSLHKTPKFNFQEESAKIVHNRPKVLLPE